MPHDVKQGDQVPLQWQLGTDVSAADTVTLKIAERVGGPLFVDRALDVDPADGTLVSTTMSTAESSTAGEYPVEIEAVWANGDIVSFPAVGYELLRIREDLD